MKPRYLYIFLDESGNFDFSKTGSRFFLLTSVTMERPFEAPKALHDLRYDLLEAREEVGDHYHATVDKQKVRNAVFEVIKTHLQGMRIDSLIVEKSKTVPALQEVEKFYPEMLGHLLKYVLRGHTLSDYTEVLIFPAALKTGKGKAAMEKAVRTTLARMLPDGFKYRLIYHSAKANFDIQIADYCTWAIAKKWKDQEFRPYEIIKSAIRSEFDYFRGGTHYYY